MKGTRVWKRQGVREGEVHDQGIIAARSSRKLLVAFYDSNEKTYQYDEETGVHAEGDNQSAEDVACHLCARVKIYK